VSSHAPEGGSVNVDTIPAELRARPQWVVWAFAEKPGAKKPTKEPRRPLAPHRLASTTDPATWSTFEVALKSLERSKADGIGYVFTADDPYFGVDLDDELSEADRGAIMAALDTYTEKSVSGIGYHVIGRGRLNGNGRHPHGLGVFDTARYFVMTGLHVRGTPTTIEPRQEQLDDVLARFLPLNRHDVVAIREPHPVDLDDRDLLDKAMAARNGAEFRVLWNGKWEDRYSSQSEADLALAGLLRFWTGADPARMDSLFRHSALMRTKWDERRGESTYGANTIALALPGDVYTAPQSSCLHEDSTEEFDPTFGEESPFPPIGAPDRETKSANEYLRSDLGNAELFADRHADRLRHVKERRLWLVWESGRWRPDTTGAAERAAKALARERLRAAADVDGEDEQKKAVGWAMTSQSDPRIRAALSLATTEPTIVLRADDLDRDPFLLGCANGTLDLRSGELRDPDPEDLITLGNEIPYEPGAACPRWDHFLEEVFNGDRDLIGYVRRLAGYSLTGDFRDQVVAVLHGSGGNGKDTMLKPIQRVVGEHAVTASMDTFTRTRDKGVRNDLARLYRARLVVASESGEGKRLDEPTIKAISGGNKIAARFLYAEHFEFVPQFKVWLITNHRPRVEGDDDAIWRRLRLIPFDVSFIGREDKQLDAKLEAELPGIFAWAVRGCLEWQADGLGLPQAVEEATHQYRIDEDVLGAFIAEQCVLEGEIEPAELREAYERFCNGIGERPLSANVLGRRLAGHGIKRVTRDRRSVYLGIRLR
jgi:putative DNA primase/helicase